MDKELTKNEWSIKRWTCDLLDLKPEYYYSVYKNGWKVPHEGKNFRTRKDAEKFINGERNERDGTRFKRTVGCSMEGVAQLQA